MDKIQRFQLWAMTVGPISLRAPGYGQVTPPRVFKFRKGKAYPITIQHLGSRLDTPDYDYTALIEPVAAGECVIVDEEGMLGVHDEGSYNFSQGKEATLYVFTLSVESVNQDDPTNQNWERATAGALGHVLVFGGSEPSTSDNLRVTLLPELPPDLEDDFEPTWSVMGDGEDEYPIPEPGTLVWDLEDVKPTPGLMEIRVIVGTSGAQLTRMVQVGIRTDDVIAVGWIDPGRVTLNFNGVAQSIIDLFPYDGPVAGPVQTALFLNELIEGNMFMPGPAQINIPMRDRRYILGWLFKHGGNADPNTVIPGGDFRSSSGDFIDESKVDAFVSTGTNYKMFNRSQIKYTLSLSGDGFDVAPTTIHADARIGITTNPLPLPPSTFPGQQAYLNGRSGASPGGGFYFSVNDGSPDVAGIRIFNNLMARNLPGSETPKYWEDIGSQIRFRANGNPSGEIITQPYPTYYIYRNGRFQQDATVVQPLTPDGHFYTNPFPFGLNSCGGLPAGRCGEATYIPDPSAPIRPYVVGPTIP